MSDREWVFGDILRRAVTMNPIYYQQVMFLGPARGRDGRLGLFLGLQLTEAPPPAVGKWVNPPPVGAVRPKLRRSLFELAPEDEQ